MIPVADINRLMGDGRNSTLVKRFRNIPGKVAEFHQIWERSRAYTFSISCSDACKEYIDPKRRIRHHRVYLSTLVLQEKHFQLTGLRYQPGWSLQRGGHCSGCIGRVISSYIELM